MPEAIRSLDTIESPDYVDLVTGPVSETPDRTPEQWLRLMLQGVPRSMLLVVPLIQRVALGLRLELRASPDHIIGWRIADRGEHHMRIEAASWFLTGHVIVHVDQGQLSFATFVRYYRTPAALVWPPISLIHRQVALALVRSATRAQ
ncbi:MAG: hypothetical protein ACRDK7_14570 [Solirubrobacteraceae bacterium]